MTPPAVIQGLVIYLFASGLVFFLGCGGVWLSVWLMVRGVAGWKRRLTVVVCLLGLILISLSAAPLPYWYYGLACTLTIAWLVVEHIKRVEPVRWTSRLRRATVMIWLAGAISEIPFQIAPTLNANGSPPLFVIADSITAGVGEREAVTWPELIRRHQQIAIHDYSRMGAGVIAGCAQADRLPDAPGIVLIEIGGNDMLGTTSLTEFERGLDRLLTRVRDRDRTVLMFELPLPPLCNEYGRIQRRVAARHRVPLVPKRLLIEVLTWPGNTLDSIHLTQAGHDHMAAVVWKLIRSAFR